MLHLCASAPADWGLEGSGDSLHWNTEEATATGLPASAQPTVSTVKATKHFYRLKVHCLLFLKALENSGEFMLQRWAVACSGCGAAPQTRSPKPGAAIHPAAPNPEPQTQSCHPPCCSKPGAPSSEPLAVLLQHGQTGSTKLSSRAGAEHLCTYRPSLEHDLGCLLVEPSISTLWRVPSAGWLVLYKQQNELHFLKVHLLRGCC